MTRATRNSLLVSTTLAVPAIAIMYLQWPLDFHAWTVFVAGWLLRAAMDIVP